METTRDDPPADNHVEVDQKMGKLARQKARSSVAMRRGTTRVQSPFSVQHPSKIPFSNKKTSLEGHLERFAQNPAERAKDEQSVASVETSSDVYSVVSRSEMSESRKSRPSRPRRPKKYPPPLCDIPLADEQRQDEAKHSVDDASLRDGQVMPQSTSSSLSNVAKLSLEPSPMRIVAGTPSSMQRAPSFRQKVKEQQKAQKRMVIQNLVPKEPQEPEGTKTDIGCSTPMSQMEQRRSRYNKVSSALQRKRFVVPTAKSISSFDELHSKHDMLEVTLTASDSASSNPSPASDSKHEHEATVEQTKTGSRLAVMAAARRTKIQNSPSKHPDGSLESEALLTSASSRLNVFATPTRVKSRTDQPEDSARNSFFTRSLDIDKMKMRGTPSSPFTSRPDPPSERIGLALASPSVTRCAALQRLSFDPALKRFQHNARNSTGSLIKGKQEEETMSHLNMPKKQSTTSHSQHRQDSPCLSRVPSLQATFSSHSESSSSNPKTSVGDVAVGDIIDIYLYRSSRKISTEHKGAQAKTAASSSFTPDSASRISESGKVSRNNKILARGSERARKSIEANGARKITEESPKKSGADAFGVPFTNLMVSTAWEAFP